MTVLNPPLGVQSRTDTNADDFRSALMAGMVDTGAATVLLPRGGILPGWGAELSVAQRAAGANMSVDVGAGVCLVPSPTNGTGGWYVVNDATLNLSIAAAHATLARIDLVIARVADPQYSVGGDGLGAVKVITGTAAGSPVPPTPAASEGAYVVLGQVAVAAAASSITNANITLNTNATRPYSVALGGVLPVANAAARTALAGYPGLHVLELDTGILYFTTAAGAWRVVGQLGTLGYAQVTANQGSITTFVDLSGLAVTVTVPAGRRLRIRAQANFSTTVGGDYASLLIAEGGTTLNGGNIPLTNNTITTLIAVDAIVTPSAGSHTYKLVANRPIGSGTLVMNAAATSPAFILVEDIGV